MAAPISSSIFRRFPVVVVLGETGTGKSKLAIQLASHFGGEIVSADSMQVYQGLDIITNKVTREEQSSCRHHLIDIVNPLSRFTVVDFRNKSVPIIERVLQEKRLPVIVGGTNYYIEALLWKVLLDDKNSNSENLLLDARGDPSTLHIRRNRKRRHSGAEHDPEQNTEESSGTASNNGLRSVASTPLTGDEISSRENAHSEERLADVTPHTCPVQRDGLMTIDVQKTATSDLHQILAELDPARAETLHPNDRRKIIRSLQVYEQHGRTHSEVLTGQQGESGGGPLGGPLRFNDLCILWLQCDQKVLDRRLEARVDSMLKKGLLLELANFHKDYNQERLLTGEDSRETLYTLGIFQSIGFKEFHPYLTLPSCDDRESTHAKGLLAEGVERLKIATRQYARRQNQWIRNRFVGRPGPNVPPVYALNSTNPTCWEDDVLNPALSILNAMIEGKVPSVLPVKRESRDPPNATATRHTCEVCDGRVFVGEQQWLGHLKSRRHDKKARKLKKAALFAKYQQHKLEIATAAIGEAEGIGKQEDG